MSSKYFKELDDTAKARYVEKLKYNGESLPDPLDEVVRRYTFASNQSHWPNIVFGDIYIYLVERECCYTKEKFKNYKGLEAYNYFLSGKVHNILSYKNTKLDIIIITCDVQASQSVKTYHTPWIVTSSDGVVHSGHCTCMAGLGEVCAHVSALLFTLEAANREDPLSVTSKPCTWKKCTKNVETSAVIDINFSRKRKVQDRKHCAPLQMPSTSAYETFLKVIKENQPGAPILNMLSDGSSSETEEEEEEEKENLNISENFASTDLYLPNLIEFFETLGSSNENLDILIENCIFSEEHISKVEAMTREQRDNEKWFHYRKGRITASLFGRVIRCIKGQKNLVKIILQEENAFKNNAMKYGEVSENLAKEKLKEYFEEQHVNAELLPTGFRIDNTYGFLGASPDAMVICDCCENALVEIKCPARGQDCSLKDIETNSFFLDKDLHLKRNHNYYDQVQGQMDIWNVNKCYFVTYSKSETNIEIITYDNNYWDVRKQILVNFFKSHVLPEILKKNCVQ